MRYSIFPVSYTHLDVYKRQRKPLFHDLEREMITSDYMDYPELQKMFLGIRGLPSVIDYAMGIQKNDTITEMTEIQRVSEEKKCFEVVAEHESYLPIIMDKPNSLMFQLEDKQVDVSLSLIHI